MGGSQRTRVLFAGVHVVCLKRRCSLVKLVWKAFLVDETTE